MYYNFPQNRKYMINKNLVVKLDSKIIETNGVDIDIEIYGVLRTVELKWLYGISLYGIVMPKGYEDNIFDIIFKPIDLKSHKVKQDVIPVFSKPVVINKIYRMIARVPRYAVSEEGDIIDITSGIQVNNYSGRAKYKHVTLSGSISFSIHRLVALTWVENDDFLNKPIVNHKDGNKLNCHYDNLEWCSFSDNVKHAIFNGLSPQAEAYRVLDTETGEENIFHSVTTLSRYMNLNTIPHLSHKVSRYRQYIIQKRYIVKSTTNENPWIPISENSRNNWFNGKTAAIIEAMNVKTGEIIKDTVTNLSKRLKINRNTLDGLKRLYTQHNGFGYVFRDPNIMNWDEINIVDNIYKPKTITAKSIVSNETIKFNSLREASRYFGCDIKTISIRLNNNKEYKSYTFKLS